MQLIYPKIDTKIYVPVKLDGSVGRAVFEVAHRDAEKLIFWHLDNIYLESTRYFHQMDLNPDPGPHQLVLIDEDGKLLE